MRNKDAHHVCLNPQRMRVVCSNVTFFWTRLNEKKLGGGVPADSSMCSVDLSRFTGAGTVV